MSEQYPIVVSPTAVARYAWLDKPDEKNAKNPYGDGKFKITLVFDKPVAGAPNPFAKMVEAITAAARQKWGPTVDISTIRKPWVDGDTHKNPDFKNKILINAKTQFKPSQVGADKAELPPEARIWAGDVVRASLVAFPYENEDDVPQVVNGQAVMENGKVKMVREKIRGVTFQLRSVQLLQKGERIGGGGAHDFDDADDVVVVTGMDQPGQRTVVKGPRPAAHSFLE